LLADPFCLAAVFAGFSATFVDRQLDHTEIHLEALDSISESSLSRAPFQISIPQPLPDVPQTDRSGSDDSGYLCRFAVC
jgi:hypothetical protein